MGLFDWLRNTLFGPPKRDVTRMGVEGDADTVAEVVDVSGGPLKEKHRRRALRDGRLLPKPKPVLPYPLRGKRKKYFTRDEADRLFAATLRTRDRKLRDLLPDVEQLGRYGLPVWKTELDVAAALGLTVPQLRFFSVHREMERAPHYVAFTIPKRDGRPRTILAPKRRLKKIQRTLLKLLVDPLPASEPAHAFRRGRSVKTGAQPHVGKKVVVRLDLKDCFPSLHVGRVRGMLVALGYGFPVATTLAVLMTESERQPVEVDGTVYHVPVTSRYCVQGAPTSPGLCNALLARLDRRLAGLARKAGFAYTRYADDLNFSGDDPGKVRRLISAAEWIVGQEGFRVNVAKTRVMRRGGPQRVTGVTVNDKLGLSRRERRKIRAEIHHIKTGKAGPGAEARVRGKLAWVAMLNPVQAEKLRERM